MYPPLVDRAGFPFLRLSCFAVALLVVCGCGSSATTNPAQRQLPDDDVLSARADAFTDSLRARLDLTEAQAKQVRPVLLEQMQRRRVLVSQFRSGDRSRRRGFREDMRAIRLQTDDQLGQILTKEQMEGYRAYLAEQRQLRESRRGRRQGGDREDG